MKKENILVIAIICIVVVGTVAYMKSNSPNLVNAGVKKNSAAIEKKTEAVIENQTEDLIKQKAEVPTTKSTKIDWQPYIQGLSNAKKEEKPVFLYFHADWCKYCKKLKTTTFADKDVLNYLSNNFISITIDTEKEREIASEWGIKGLPNLWFLKADNSKISNIPGYIEAEQFLNVLKYIRTNSYEKMSFSDFLKIKKVSEREEK